MAVSNIQIKKIVAVAKAYGATRLILFGSALKTPGKARDIDLACDGMPGWKLYEFAARLEEDIKTNLDIVPLTPSTKFTKLIEEKGKALL